MSEFWLCFNCCIAEQPQPVSMKRYTYRLGGVLVMHTVDSQVTNQDPVVIAGQFQGLSVKF